MINHSLTSLQSLSLPFTLISVSVSRGLVLCSEVLLRKVFQMESTYGTVDIGRLVTILGNFVVVELNHNI